MTSIQIPFHVPYATGRELTHLGEVLSTGHLSMSGAATARCERLIEQITHCHRSILTTSCTDALEMIALLLDIGPGDEVIMPSFTFVSTANAFALRGATCVFVDVDPASMNMSAALAAAALTPRTRAIVAVHYGGLAPDIHNLRALADAAGIHLVEDAAQGIGASCRGKPAGSWGTVAALSFHQTKNIHCGEGGALLLNDPALIERAEILRDKGTDRMRFGRGLVAKYTWQDIGSSFGCSELNAAFLVPQLEDCLRVTQRRREVWSTYQDAFRSRADSGEVELACVPPDCEGNGHLYYLKVGSESLRDRLQQFLESNGIGAASHYVPLHSAPQGARRGRFHGVDSGTTQGAGRLLRLPIYPQLTLSEVTKVIDVTLEWMKVGARC